jgi:hypothetical protein
MTQSTRVDTNTRKKRPKQTGQMVGARLQPELLKQLDDWRRAQPDLPSRPEALRRLAEKGLASRD